MIKTIVGKPGGGKSFYSLKEIAAVLANTEQVIVSNLSINVPALEAFIAKRYPDRVIDVSKRIRLLDEKQAGRFWLFRLDADGGNVDLQGVTREEEKEGKRVDYARITNANAEALAAGKPRVYPGCLYVIDECHVFFDARAWAENGFSLTFYNSQHRKLDDDVLFVTQFLELIDKRVKGFSQEFVYLRNNGAEKFMTLFRGPSYFTAKHYQRPPSGMQDFPSEVHRFSLDKALADCYDTSAGVGIRGVGKPETKKKKGLSIAWLAVPVLLVMFVMHQGPDWLARGVAGTDRGRSIAGQAGLFPGAKGGASTQPGAATPATEQAPDGVQPADGAALAADLPPYPTGYVVVGRRVTIQMSDGTTRTERDAELTRIERNSVTLSGEKLFFKPAARPMQAQPSTEPFSPVVASAVPPPTVSVGAVEPEKWNADTGPLGKPSGRIGR